MVRAVALAVLFGLVGCRTTTKLKPEEESSITAGRKSLVLFRPTVSDPKNPQRILPMRGFRARLARMDPPEPVQVFASNYDDMNGGPWVLAPTESSVADGWRCLALEPGGYYLELTHTQGPQLHLDFCSKARLARNVPRDNLPGQQSFGRYGQIFSNEFRLLPAYRLDVPSNAPVVYAGRFHLEQRLEKDRDFSPFKQIRVGESSILDEAAVAHQIARERFPALGSNDFVCRLATPLADPSPLLRHLPTLASEVEPIPGPPFTSTDVASHAASIYGGPVVWLAEFIGSGSGGGCCGGGGDGREALVSLGLILAAAPFAATADKLAGDPIRKKWAPRQAELRKQFEEFKLEQRLAQLLTQRLQQRPATADPSKASATLQVQPTRVCLREVRSGQFALEVAVRFRVREAHHGQLIWEQTLVNSDSFDARQSEFWFLPFPYEALIAGQTTVRPLSDYESPAARDLLQQDLEEAVSALASGFLDIIGSAPP